MKGRLEKLFVAISSAWGMFHILIMRPRVIVFSNDVLGSYRYEPRMARVFEWLEAKRIPYANLIHVTPHGRVIRHWLRRHKPVVYLEGIEYLAAWALPWLLRRCGARQLWAIDDFRHWPRVTSAARKAGVRSVLFQHGRFTVHQPLLRLEGTSPESLSLPDVYIVWNEFWRQRLLAVSPPFAAHPELIRVGGKASAAVSSESRNGSFGEPFSVLLLHEPASPASEVSRYAAAFLEIPGCRLFYKVRPDRASVEQLGGFPDAVIYHSRFSDVKDVPDDVSLVAGAYSTLLYESVERGFPVGVLKMSSTQAEDLVQEGLASMIDISAGDLLGQVRSAAAVPHDELARRADRLRVAVDIEMTLANLLHA